MKSIKYLSILIIVVLTLGQGFAQDDVEIIHSDTRKGIHHMLGVKGGMNISWLNLDPRVNQKITVAPLFGLSYIYFPQHFGGLMLEAQYIKYGWTEDFLDSLSSYSREISYLEFPVLTNFVIGKKNTHLKFQLGVKVDVLLNEKENMDVPENRQRLYYGQKIEDLFELGLAFGTSLSRKFTFGEFQIDLRFNHSLSNLFESTEDLSLIYSQNQAISFAVYYWWSFK